MMNRISDILTYATLAFLVVFFLREGIRYVAYDIQGVVLEVVKPAELATKTDGKSLKFLTYNVLVTPVALDRRMAPLFRILRDSDADVMALQEVGANGEWFMAQLEKEDWAKKYYRVGANPGECGGQFILSKLPAEAAICYGLPGKQRRTVLIATLLTAAGPFKLATTHMESPPRKDKVVRASQLDKIFEKLGRDGDAALLGDVNFGDGEPEGARLDPAYTDIWRKLRPKEHGFTWDNEKSGLADSTRFPGEPSRRLDRVLVRSKTWKAGSIKIIGDKPTDAGKNDMFPSDHFGLSGTLTR